MTKKFRLLLAVLICITWAAPSSAIPISESVYVEGTYWSQVKLFTGLSWNDINAVCPGGVCGAGTLNGYDMDGWIWASLSETNDLINSFLSAAGVFDLALLSGEPGDLYWDLTRTWAPALMEKFEITTQRAIGQDIVWGLTSTATGGLAESSRVIHGTISGLADVAANRAYLIDDGSPNIGAYFYYADGVPPIDVSVAGTITLFGLGLAGLGVGRRKPM